MDKSVRFLKIEFMEDSRLLKRLGEGTFGAVGLYETPFGEKVIKETKIKNKSLSHPPDLLFEIDSLIKFRASPHIVRLEGICLSPSHRKGYILLEKLDDNLSAWGRKHTFQTRNSYIDRLIKQIGPTLALMHRFQMVHNDLKPNNFLVKDTPDGPIFKLADFGKAVHVTKKHAYYGGLAKYCPPFLVSSYSSEYWAFLMCSLEFLVGQDRFIRERDLKQFEYRYLHREQFQLRDYLRDTLHPDEYSRVPEIFWKFFEPICQDLESTVDQGCKNIGIELGKSIVQNVESRILRPVRIHPKFRRYQKEFQETIDRYKLDQYEDRIGQLLNIFLDRLDDKEHFEEQDVQRYAEVAIILVARRKIRGYTHFKTQVEFLNYERAFLEVLGFQVWAV